MTQSKAADLTRISLFVSLMIVGAYIKIPTPFVPFSLQFLMVNLSGLLLRKNQGTMAVFLYLTLGLLGFPVFASGGGISYIFHPGFAYLLGFIACTFVNCRVYEKLQQKQKHAGVLAGIAGMCALYLVALPYLYILLNFWLKTGINLRGLLGSFFLLFLPSDLLSVVASGFLVRRLHAVGVLTATQP